jgi:predicted phosphate transport protein (TIGR00153 family)
MRFSLVPRDRRFYGLFADLARRLVQTSETLVDLLEHYENVEMKTIRLKELEHEADNVTHEIYRLVHQSFVTPLDREDIAALAQSMDDVVDFLEGAATSLRVYRIDKPTTPSLGLADIARLQCVQLERAIGILGQRGRLREILEQVKEINRLENEADALFLSAMGELFDGEWSTIDVIKWRDIYDLLEEATDSCESVAHALEAIVLKHA